jgi:TP901 family phage tail tape measure protein
MASRIYEIAFKIGGQIASSLPKSLQGASAQLAAVNAKIVELEKAQGTVTRFHDLHKQIEATGAKLRAAEAEKRKFDQQMRSAPSPALGRLAGQYDAAASKSAKLRAELQLQLHQLQGVKTAMEAAGVTTRSLGADTEKLAAKMAKARGEESKLKARQAAKEATQNKLDAARSKYSESKGKLLGAAAGVAAFAIPAKMAAEFEDSMVRAGALANANDAQYAAMAAQARQLGRDTRFSGIDAAHGMQLLAQSGFKAEQIMQTMPGMLDIAAAGMVDIGEASDITASILRGFGMRESETAHLGDVLANTFTSSSTTLSSLGETMKYVGPVAASTSTSLEMMAAAAGKLGSAGIKGGEAGTALRAMMLRLASPRAKGIEALQRLGVDTLNRKTKNLLPFEEILANMSKKMAKMGSGTKAAMIDAVFGIESASAATVLLGEAGSGALQKYAESLKAEGTAAKIAAKQNATMAGQWDNFKGSVEEVGVSIGYALIPMLKRLIDQVVPVINKTTQWMSDNPELTETIVKVGLALATLNLGLVAGSAALNGVHVAMLVLQSAAGPIMLEVAAAVGPVLLALGLLVAAGYLVGKNWNEIKEGGVMAWNAIRNSVEDTVKYIQNITLEEAGKAIMRTLAKGLLAASPLPLNTAMWVAEKLGLIGKKAEDNSWMSKVVFTDRPELGKQVLAASEVTSSANVSGSAYGMSSASDLGSGVGSLDAAGKLSGGSSSRSGPSAPVINYSPNINLPPGTPAENRREIERGAATSQRQFADLMKQFMDKDGRLSFE